MNQDERLIAERLLAKLIPYIEVKDSGAAIAVLHKQLTKPHHELRQACHSKAPAIICDTIKCRVIEFREAQCLIKYDHNGQTEWENASNIKLR